jgi:hypothetical protein
LAGITPSLKVVILIVGSYHWSAAVSVVLKWHAALNAGDAERVVALSTADVEVGGPRGAGRGADVLRDWVARSGIRLAPRRVYAAAETVVVEQDATWPAAEGPLVLASLFGVRDGRVARVLRFDDLAAALAAGGLDESARVAEA